MSRTRGPLVRTSVQLSSETLEVLDERWPGLNRSEALRLAFERFQYFDWQSRLCADLIEEHGGLLKGALVGLDYDDFRAVARALPSLVMGYVRESGVEMSDEAQERLERQLETLEPHDRLQILDFAASSQRH